MTTLTPRQLEILRLSAEGFSGPQIAVRLHVTVATVNEHRTRIRNRLGASTAAHAVAIAYQRGILQGFDGTDVLRQLDSARAWAVHWQQESAEVLRLLAELVDGDPCWWDHNHSCQAHGFFYIPQGEHCPHEEAKALLRPPIEDAA